MTERKQTEQLIMDANAYAESIVGTVREPLVILDQNLRVKTASQSFYRDFKVNPRETENQLLYDLGNGQWDIPRLRTLLEEVLPQNNQFNDFEVEHTFEDIGHRTMLLNARRIHQQGNQSELILLAIEDITARKEAENTIKRYQAELEERNRLLRESNEQLEKLGAVKDEFLRMASHDLKNPLAAITITASLFSLKLPRTNSPPEMQDLLGRIMGQCRVMQKIIEDFVDFHALEDGRIKLTLEAVDINALARDVLERNADYAARKQISTHLDLDPDAPLVNADKNRVNQVLENFISNAFKFSPPGEQVTIGTRKTETGVLVEVRDSGPGLTDEDMDKVFVKYAKLSNQPTGGEKSSGLGLAICKKIIEIQGGKTGARNNPEAGATFWFEIPRNFGSPC